MPRPRNISRTQARNMMTWCKEFRVRSADIYAKSVVINEAAKKKDHGYTPDEVLEAMMHSHGIGSQLMIVEIVERFLTNPDFIKNNAK